jgi:dephospho-CoA kinase
MRIYALTGGIGSGKSEAARRFEALGIPVIDADRIGHEIIEPGGEAERGVIDAFGEDILSNGRIDRKKLADRVFGDPGALRLLNALTHPAVLREIARRTANLATAGNEKAIIEAALHAEDGTVADWMAGLILVSCPEEMRAERLVRHRSMTPEEARVRIAAQTPPERKAPLARWIIQNDGDLNHLQEQVEQVAREL